MLSPRIITLLTDFGTRDAYVGTMKGVVLGIAPEVQLIDISHEIGPQQIVQGGFLLASSSQFFPAHAVHLAVVDPGVGTARRGLAVSTFHGIFVGPDNGLLSLALLRDGAIDRVGAVQEGAHAVELLNDRYRLHPVSTTFHGRDIFAPAAAHLAAGVPLEALGPTVAHIVPALLPSPTEDHKAVRGTVIHIDRFGNAITNLSSEFLSPDFVISAGSFSTSRLSSTYTGKGVLALIGSSGYLEIAVAGGSAAHDLGLRIGDEVTVRSRT